MVLGRFSEMALSPALLLGFRHIIHQMKAYNFFSITPCDSTGSCFGLKDRHRAAICPGFAGTIPDSVPCPGCPGWRLICPGF